MKYSFDISIINLDALITRVNELRKFRWREPAVKMRKEDLTPLITLFRLDAPEHVILTPIGKALAKQYDGKDELTQRDELYTCEKEVFSFMYKLGLSHYGPPVFDYEDTDRYASVDFWRNFLKMGREVTPNTNSRRQASLNNYQGISDTFKISNEVFLKTTHYVLQLLSIKRSCLKSESETQTKHFRAPFQNYNTNVGYPFFKNDRTLENGSKYGEIVYKMSRSFPIAEIPYMPAVMFGRDQRAGIEVPEGKELGEVISSGNLKFKPSKARAIWGTSRLCNIKLSSVIKPLIAHLKNTTPFSGYKSDVEMIPYVHRMKILAEKRNLLLYNNDYTQFDATISNWLNVWKEMIYEYAFRDTYGKKLIKLMTTWGSKMPIIDGVAKLPPYKTVGNYLTYTKMRFFSGGQKSGELDTNSGGGLKNMLVMISTMLTIDDEYYSKLIEECINTRTPYIMVMGDDNLTFFRNQEDHATASKLIKERFDMNVSTIKGEKGPFFLQKRVTSPTQWITPSPRIVSKLIWLEREKGLGPYGWVMSNIMKLMDIRFNPETPEIVRWVAKFDKLRWGTCDEQGREITPSQFISHLTEESRKYGLTIEQRLSDGNPQKDIFSDDGSISSKYLTEAFALIREALKRDAGN